MPESTHKNDNLRSAVTVIEEAPDLDRLGKAGIRLKLDLMLLAIHGQPEQVWQRLNNEEREVLRQIAREEDPAWGISHQAGAIGALAEAHDQTALLQLAELARDNRADLRIQIAATHALGAIGTEQVRPTLHGLLKAKAPEVRAQAAKALVKTGAVADLAALEVLAEQDETFAAEVARKALATLRARLQVE